MELTLMRAEFEAGGKKNPGPSSPVPLYVGWPPRGGNTPEALNPGRKLPKLQPAYNLYPRIEPYCSY